MHNDNVLQEEVSLFQSGTADQVQEFPKPAPLDTERPCHEYDDEGSFEHFFAHERRRHRRRAVGKTIRYFIISSNGTIEESGLNAYVVDISDGGMGILTDHHLETGCILCFSGEDGWNMGLVRWSMNFILQNRYRVGVQFV